MEQQARLSSDWMAQQDEFASVRPYVRTMFREGPLKSSYFTVRQLVQGIRAEIIRQVVRR